MPAVIKAEAIDDALNELWKPNAQDIADHILRKHGKKYTRQEIAHCIRYGVRNVKIMRPIKHHRNRGNIYIRGP